MSEEEKKAIKRIEQLKNGIGVGIILNVKSDGPIFKSLEIVLNLIEKQQKENEMLKNYLSEQGMISDYLKWRKKNKNV